MKRTCFESGDQDGLTQQPPVVSCRNSGVGLATGSVVGAGTIVGGLLNPPESGGRRSGEPDVATGGVWIGPGAGEQAANRIKRKNIFSIRIEFMSVDAVNPLILLAILPSRYLSFDAKSLLRLRVEVLDFNSSLRLLLFLFNLPALIPIPVWRPRIGVVVQQRCAKFCIRLFIGILPLARMAEVTLKATLESADEG
jgi:hypothetical protein